MVFLKQMKHEDEFRQLNESVRPFYGKAKTELTSSCLEAIFLAQNIMTLQNNLTLISYRNRRYYLRAGANCQSVCVSYLPDRGKAATRRVDKLRMQRLLPHGGRRVLGSRAADVGSGINRSAR